MEPFRKGAAIPTLEPRREQYDAPQLQARITYRELGRVEYLTATTVQPEYTFVGTDGARYLTEMGVAIRTADTVAAGCIDPETGEKLWTGQEVIAWPQHLWDDARELEKRILALSEVGAESLKKSDPAADAGGAAGPDRRGHGEPGAGAGAAADQP